MLSRYGNIPSKIRQLKQEIEFIQQEIDYLENPGNEKEILLSDCYNIITHYEEKLNKDNLSAIPRLENDKIKRKRLELLTQYDKTNNITKEDLDVYYTNFPYDIQVYT